jgi:predicted ribosomally synthesized peptide with nif11-like leader
MQYRKTSSSNKEFGMDAKQFLNTCSTSLTHWDTASVVRMAHAQGYQFTADELETAADELWGNLSEDQLREVAGGGSIAPSLDGPVTADTSSVKTISTSTSFEPAPGDVSGNSCFFTRR